MTTGKAVRESFSGMTGGGPGTDRAWISQTIEARGEETSKWQAGDTGCLPIM